MGNGRNIPDQLNKKDNKMKSQTAPKQHSTYGASSSFRYLNCPGSIALSKKAPPPKESAYAKEGTDAHECLEKLVRDSTSSNIATCREQYGNEMVEHALETVEWLKAKLKSMPGSKVLCEAKVDASHFTRPGEFGTLDLGIVSLGRKLVVIDYKYGSGVAVNPEENTQMIYYALGLLKRYNYNFSEVELVIKQPRAWHESGKTTRFWNVSLTELRNWEEKFKEGVKLCESEDAPLASGDWCKFCPATIICPEVKERSLKEAQIAFSDETGIEKLPEPKAILEKNLGVILTACERLETWIEKVREHALHVLESGGVVPGWKLVQKRSIRKYIDINEASKIAMEDFGEKAFSEPELLSPAQLEKALGAENVKDFITAQVTDVSSGVRLAPDTDKGKAVDPFKAFDEAPKLEEPKKVSAKKIKQPKPTTKRKKR